MTSANALPLLVGLLFAGAGVIATVKAKKTGVALGGLLFMLAGGWFMVVSVPDMNTSTWRGFWLLLVVLLAAFVLVFRSSAGGSTVIGLLLGVISVALMIDLPPVNNLELGGWVGEVFDTLGEIARWVADRVANL